MKPKNKTKKNKQKGGNPYQLDVEAASIFYLLYSTMMHSRTKEEIEEVNNMIFDFFNSHMTNVGECIPFKGSSIIVLGRFKSCYFFSTPFTCYKLEGIIIGIWLYGILFDYWVNA